MEAVRPKPFNPYIAKTVSQFIKVDGVNTKEVEKLKKTVKPKPVLKKNPKPKLKKSVKNKVELPEVLPGNGQHKAVGIIQGVLSTDGFKLTKKGKKLQKYILKIEKYNVEVKAKLTLGARKLAETKPDALLDKPHNFIVYPKFNKDGFHIEVVAFDDTHKSPISSVCSDCEFLFMGVWNRGRLLVQ